MDPVHTKIQDRLAACGLPGDEIAAVAQKQAVRLDDAGLGVGRTVNHA